LWGESGSTYPQVNPRGLPQGPARAGGDTTKETVQSARKTVSERSQQNGEEKSVGLEGDGESVAKRKRRGNPLVSRSVMLQPTRKKGEQVWCSQGLRAG